MWTKFHCVNCVPRNGQFDADGKSLTRAKLDVGLMRRILHGEGITYSGLGDGVTMTTDKPLTPLTHGNILIVGAKASNFDEELRTHPRIIMWDSQNENWTDKDLPHNTQAIFFTRFIGHSAFSKIVSEARKRKLTVFNPEGTGQIIRQVKELLNMPKPVSFVPASPPVFVEKPVIKRGGPTVKGHSKLNPLMQFVDPSKTVIANAHVLFEKAKEMGIETTVLSIANKVSAANRKRAYMKRPGNIVKPSETPQRLHKHVDVVVEILDNMVKELQDMRDFLVATTEENRELKARFEMFKKALG